MPLLGSVVDGFDDWLAENGYTPGSRKFSVRILPYVDAVLRRRRVRAVASLTIFETKFRKSRLVPLHSTTSEVLRHYKKLRSEARVAQPADPFFISDNGKPVPYYTLKNLFGRLVTRAGFSDANHRRRPSLHSLRHSFAVERLTIWYQEGRDVRPLAPNLSVYMGHVRLSASYWYFSTSPDLLNAGGSLLRLCQKGG